MAGLSCDIRSSVRSALLKYIDWTDRTSMMLRDSCISILNGDKKPGERLPDILKEPLIGMPLRDPVLLRDWTWERWLAEDYTDLEEKETGISLPFRTHEFAAEVLRLAPQTNDRNDAPLNPIWKGKASNPERYKLYGELIVLAEENVHREDLIFELDTLQREVLIQDEKREDRHRERIDTICVRIETIYIELEQSEKSSAEIEEARIKELTAQNEETRKSVRILSEERRRLEEEAARAEARAAVAKQRLQGEAASNQTKLDTMREKLRDVEQDLAAGLEALQRARAEHTLEGNAMVQKLENEIDARKSERQQLKNLIPQLQSRVNADWNRVYYYEEQERQLRDSSKDGGFCTIL